MDQILRGFWIFKFINAPIFEHIDLRQQTSSRKFYSMHTLPCFYIYPSDTSIALANSHFPVISFRFSQSPCLISKTKRLIQLSCSPDPCFLLFERPVFQYYIIILYFCFSQPPHFTSIIDQYNFIVLPFLSFLLPIQKVSIFNSSLRRSVLLFILFFTLSFTAVNQIYSYSFRHLYPNSSESMRNSLKSRLMQID